MYDRQGSTYLFDLDYVEDVYTVDAAHQGNVSHFVNHSVSVRPAAPVSVRVRKEMPQRHLGLRKC